ncbi:MAG: antibiotic biosynthesis monooxygenase [Bacteroidetes bacterium]|jgi:quinol monooxygenase YgiN|nr:antibiotic biosynthesis monooxygenase [Bacteroidota bacterium]MBK7040311.1 antibiotic biosynthesis monooxygenase [Bacteroidota bacterium]
MIRIVKLSFKATHVADFKAFFELRKSLIRNVEGCTHLALWQDHDDDCVFYTYSLWQAPEFLALYRNSDLFKETWTQVKQWFDKPPMAFSANQILTL